MLNFFNKPKQLFWAYRVVEESFSAAQLDQKLGHLGREGWELVSDKKVTKARVKTIAEDCNLGIVTGKRSGYRWHRLIFKRSYWAKEPRFNL